MKLPKLYAPVKLKFWSLRNGLGDNYGMVFDCDVEVTRSCRRVLCPGGWKWQIVNYARDVDWDWSLVTDKEILDEYLSDIEYIAGITS